MKPLLSREEDTSTLQDLGRASVQIVHDLKNQLNGLKLYATFLRKRLEKSDRPDDEQETVTKLISGLDRAANDLSTIVQYGREIELKKQPGFEFQKVVRAICSSLNETGETITDVSDADNIQGNFDHTKLSDALRWISVVAVKHSHRDEKIRPVTVNVKFADTEEKSARIEWSELAPVDHDPFRSFAGSDEIRMSLAAKIVEAHGGSARYEEDRFVVDLPLAITKAESSAADKEL
jgi:light-regulated signal transduction histidine kinase (bacteriophytochrome)